MLTKACFTLEESIPRIQKLLGCFLHWLRRMRHKSAHLSLIHRISILHRLCSPPSNQVTDHKHLKIQRTLPMIQFALDLWNLSNEFILQLTFWIGLTLKVGRTFQKLGISFHLEDSISSWKCPLQLGSLKISVLTKHSYHQSHLFLESWNTRLHSQRWKFTYPSWAAS